MRGQSCHRLLGGRPRLSKNTVQLAAATGFDVHGLLAGRYDRIQLVYRLVCDFTVAAELWRQIWAQKPGLACLCLQCLPLCRLVLLYKPYCHLLNHGKFWGSQLSQDQHWICFHDGDASLDSQVQSHLCMVHIGVCNLPMRNTLLLEDKQACILV